jgi:hypothetical protein
MFQNQTKLTRVLLALYKEFFDDIVKHFHSHMPFASRQKRGRETLIRNPAGNEGVFR